MENNKLQEKCVNDITVNKTAKETELKNKQS